jgi:hypothetical protein
MGEPSINNDLATRSLHRDNRHNATVTDPIAQAGNRQG